MKMTKEYILECLDKYCTFEMLHEHNFEEQVVEPLQSANCFSDWSWDNGATKGVLIFKNLDFVIKIPFEGSCSWTESHYENKNGSWIYDWDSRWNSNLRKVESEEQFFEFEGSPAAGDSKWNYCQAEADLTVAAEEDGILHCFAATKFLGLANGHPIYSQEKCFMFSDASSSTNKEKYKNRTKQDYESLRQVRKRVGFWDICDDWVLDFLIYWGEEILKKLNDFMFAHCIEDLHNGNIGYRNGIPCLVDYSSFRD